MFDQVPRDCGAGAIEFGSAMAGFAEQHDLAAGKTVEHAAEAGVIEAGQWLGRFGDQLRQSLVPRRTRLMARRRVPSPIEWVTDQRNEADRAKMLLLERGLRAARQLHQFLRLIGMADRDHQPAADLELCLQRWRDLRSSSGDKDGVEFAAAGPALRSVTVFQFDVAVAEPAEAFACLGHERGVPLDGADLPRDLRRHRRGIAGTGADLENPVAFADFGGFQHQGNDIGLRDGLAFANREGTVLIGEFLKSFVDKRFTRDAAHRR